MPREPASPAAGSAPRAVRLLLNPATLRGRTMRRFDAVRAVDGIEILETASADDVTLQARRAAEDGHRRLLVAGGDGTIHYAVRGLAGTACALAIVPTGTGNDLARALGIPRDLVAAVHRGLTGTARRIDLGHAGGIPFATVAGCGFVGEVSAFVNERVRAFRGPLAYLYAVPRTFFAFTPPVLTVETDDRRIDGPALLVAVANGAFFGGGMKIAPGADVDDGTLDVVFVRPVPARRLLAVLPRVYGGTHVDDPAVTVVRSRRVTIRADRPVPLFADGERMPASADFRSVIEVRRRALEVIV